MFIYSFISLFFHLLFNVRLLLINNQPGSPGPYFSCLQPMHKIFWLIIIYYLFIYSFFSSYIHKLFNVKVLQIQPTRLAWPLRFPRATDVQNNLFIIICCLIFLFIYLFIHHSILLTHRPQLLLLLETNPQEVFITYHLLSYLSIYSFFFYHSILESYLSNQPGSAPYCCCCCLQ